VVQFVEDGLLQHEAQFRGSSMSGWSLHTEEPVQSDDDGSPRVTVGGYASYGDRKPYVVPERLDDLCGPTAGTVTLPPHLDWSGNASYDLGKPARLASMYRSVLNEAGSADDLRAWLDGRMLAQLWPTLWLPAALRRMWEHRFPELGRAQVA
jgi:hypothetical protein